VFQYRTRSRQQRRVAIGLHGPLTAEKARETAADLYEAVRKGRDPAEEQKTTARRVPDKIEIVMDEFIQRYLAGKGRAPSYIEDTRANFANHVLPRWRGREIKTVTRRDVIELLDAIVDQGKPVAANRTLAAVRKLFNWALQRGIIEASPVALVEMPGPERKRERTLAADEIRAVWDAAGELGYPFGHFFQMARHRTAAGRGCSYAMGRYRQGRAHLDPFERVDESRPRACRAALTGGAEHSRRGEGISKEVTRERRGRCAGDLCLHDPR